MISYTFKTYIADGREWFECGGDEISGWQKVKKDFPFPESLLKLLYLDIWSLEPLTRKIEKALFNLYQTKEEQYAQEVLGYLDELATVHIYFAPGLFYSWSEKAREKKTECEEGGITLEEFGQWLKDS